MPARLRLLRGINPTDPRPIRAIKALGENAICLKRDLATSVWHVRDPASDLIVKQWRLTRPKRRLQALLRRTPAFTHWQAARRLERAAIRTARCLTIARGWRDDAPCEWLVMEYLQGRTVLQILAEAGLSPRQEHRLAEAVGRQVWRFADARIHNRDHKPSNLIVQGEIRPDDLPTIAVIDCVGIRRRANAAKMTKALVAECLGTAVLPRRTVLMRCVWAMSEVFAEDLRGGDRPLDAPGRRRIRRMIWRDTARALARHGDPTPRVNPLAPHATDRRSERSVP